MSTVSTTPNDPVPGPISAQAQLKGYMEIPVVFKTGPRPPGTPGKAPFHMRDVLGLDDATYTLVLDGIRTICIQLGINMNKGIKAQHQPTLRRVYARAAEVFPGLNDFDDPAWPVHSFVYVILKSKMDRSQENRRQKALALAKAMAAGLSHPPGSPSDAARREARQKVHQEAGRKAAQTRMARKAALQARDRSTNNDSVEDLTRELSMASISLNDIPGREDNMDVEDDSVVDTGLILPRQDANPVRPHPRIPTPANEPTDALTPTGPTATTVVDTQELRNTRVNTPSPVAILPLAGASAPSRAPSAAPSAPAPSSTRAPASTLVTESVASSTTLPPKAPTNSRNSRTTRTTRNAPTQSAAPVAIPAQASVPGPVTRRTAARNSAAATAPNSVIPFHDVSPEHRSRFPGTLFEVGAHDPESYETHESSGSELTDPPEEDFEEPASGRGRGRGRCRGPGAASARARGAAHARGTKNGK